MAKEVGIHHLFRVLKMDLDPRGDNNDLRLGIVEIRVYWKEEMQVEL
jgi:hypothetical protein